LPDIRCLVFSWSQKNACGVVRILFFIGEGGVAWFWRLRSTMVELLARICCAEEYDPETVILLLPLLAVKSERAREGAN